MKSDRSEASDGQKIRCKCGVDAYFDEIDRGQTVYCPSCGAAITVPEVSDTEHTGGSYATKTTLEHLSTASVFSDQGLADLQTIKVGNIPCLCGRDVEIRLRDFGGTVYCDSCGSGLPVTRSLMGHRRRIAAATHDDEQDDTSEEISSNSVAPPSYRIRIVGLTAIASCCVVISLLLGHALTSRTPALWQADITPLAQPAESANLVTDERVFEPRSVTTDAIAELVGNPEPFRALMLARVWLKGLRDAGSGDDDARIPMLEETTQQILKVATPKMLAQIDELSRSIDKPTALHHAQAWRETLLHFAVESSDTRLTRLDRLIGDLKDSVDPITMALINSLLEQADSAQALVQAEVWQQRLRDQKVPATETRWMRLNEVITMLRRKCAPVRRQSPPHVAEFRAYLQEMGEALKRENLPAARSAANEASRLLQGHQQDLEIFERRFALLREKLQLFESLIADVSEIRELLDEAQEAAHHLDVTLAMEREAEARLMASSTTMTRLNARILKDETQEVRREIRLAKGVRAVRAAQRFNEADEIAERNQQVRLAYRLLPGLPDAMVADYLDQISEWAKESWVDAAQTQSISQSRLARSLRIREHYESTLEDMAQGDFTRLLLSSLAVHDSLQGSGSIATALDDRLVDNLIAVLDAVSSDVRPDNMDHIADLDDLRNQLANAAPWHENPRWNDLDKKLQAVNPP